MLNPSTQLRLEVPMSQPGIKKSYCVGIHRNSFRPGEPALVTGVKFCTPHGLPSRPCFQLKFKDGFKDQIPIFAGRNGNDANEPNPHIVLISEDDVKAGNIPKVTE